MAVLYLAFLKIAGKVSLAVSISNDAFPGANQLYGQMKT
jgi:hypothetical protein